MTYKVVVTNNTPNSTEALTLTSLSDDKFGDLKGQGDCTVPQTLAANGGTYSCSFQRPLPAGDPATSHVNTKKPSRRKSGTCLFLGSNPRARFAA